MVTIYQLCWFEDRDVKMVPYISLPSDYKQKFRASKEDCLNVHLAQMSKVPSLYLQYWSSRLTALVRAQMAIKSYMFVDPAIAIARLGLSTSSYP